MGGVAPEWALSPPQVLTRKHSSRTLHGLRLKPRGESQNPPLAPSRDSYPIRFELDVGTSGRICTDHPRESPPTSQGRGSIDLPNRVEQAVESSLSMEWQPRAFDRVSTKSCSVYALLLDSVSLKPCRNV